MKMAKKKTDEKSLNIDNISHITAETICVPHEIQARFLKKEI